MVVVAAAAAATSAPASGSLCGCAGRKQLPAGRPANFTTNWPALEKQAGEADRTGLDRAGQDWSRVERVGVGRTGRGEERRGEERSADSWLAGWAGGRAAID